MKGVMPMSKELIVRSFYELGFSLNVAIAVKVLGKAHKFSYKALIRHL